MPESLQLEPRTLPACHWAAGFCHGQRGTQQRFHARFNDTIRRTHYIKSPWKSMEIQHQDQPGSHDNHDRSFLRHLARQADWSSTFPRLNWTDCRFMPSAYAFTTESAACCTITLASVYQASEPLQALTAWGLRIIQPEGQEPPNTLGP